MPVGNHLKMKKNQNNKVDITQYKIIEQKYPFRIEIFDLFFGEIEDCIQTFEKLHGKIDGEIYVSGSLIGIVSSQVQPHGSKNGKNNLSSSTKN